MPPLRALASEFIPVISQTHLAHLFLTSCSAQHMLRYREGQAVIQSSASATGQTHELIFLNYSQPSCPECSTPRGDRAGLAIQNTPQNASVLVRRSPEHFGPASHPGIQEGCRSGQLCESNAVETSRSPAAHKLSKYSPQ